MRTALASIALSIIALSPALADPGNGNGGVGNGNGIGNEKHILGAPAPLLGAGLPGLGVAVGYGAYWLIRRRRRNAV